MLEDNTNDEFPEDELDYYLKLLDESHRVGHQMINSTDLKEKQQLTERYTQLQKWLDEISFNNIWND
jgi:hypothetical protein